MALRLWAGPRMSCLLRSALKSGWSTPTNMDNTNQYYKQFAAEFFSSTVNVDMAALRQRFVANLRPGAHILDAGCGSGRDAKAFALAGFKVSAFDASPELACLASAHCGFCLLYTSDAADE